MTAQDGPSLHIVLAEDNPVDAVLLLDPDLPRHDGEDVLTRLRSALALAKHREDA